MRVPLPCLQRPGPWLGPGGVRRAAAPGPVQAAAVLRGSKANILQGRYFPCSAHAQFKRPLCSSKRASGLLFLMHTVKGKKITVIHLLRACRVRISSFKPSEERSPFQGQYQLASPLRATVPGSTGPWRRQLQCTVPLGSSAQLFGFWVSQSNSPGPCGKCRRLWILPTGIKAPKKKP